MQAGENALVRASAPGAGRKGTVMGLGFDNVEVDDAEEGQIVRKDATELLCAGSAAGPNAMLSSGCATSAWRASAVSRVQGPVLRGRVQGHVSAGEEERVEYFCGRICGAYSGG